MLHVILVKSNLMRKLDGMNIIIQPNFQKYQNNFKQKSCAKRISLVTDDGLFDRKAFYTVKIVFYSSSRFILLLAV